NTASQYLVGVQVQIPLYTGGQRDAKLQEQLRLEDKARADLDSARLTIAQQTRGTWLQLQAGTARAQALEAAVRAAQLRLQATELGRQVGDRTTLELLQAQQDAMQAESNLLQHRATMAQLRLQLAALAGRLDEPALLAATDPAWTIGTP
ncbi:MAG: transporter, partial [Burkholderiaceae bacterium]